MGYLRCLFNLITCFLFLLPYCNSTTAPNVLVIVADDLGYNDISWHNPDIISPNLDKLAKDGIILENHYVQPICSPTRAALMTSYYPIHTGRQHGVIKPQMPKGLFTNFTIMAEYFKEIGYQTHAIGKWHLGFCNEDYLPTRRGFDTFYGFYTGSQDYFTHLRKADVGEASHGYDFRDQEEVDYSADGVYSSILFGERAVQVIKESSAYNNEAPIFMYLPFQNVHSPLQVPKEYEDLYPNIKNNMRRKFSGMVSAMDDAVGLIVDELKTQGKLENTIIVFTADNGGQVDNGGNNYPLRGNKGTLWEGGMRSSAFVYSSRFKEKGIISNDLFHVVDWTPTLLAAVKDDLSIENQAKVDEFLSEERDGINQWDVLMGNDPEPGNERTELLYNIDPDTSGYGGGMVGGAIRIGNLKLIRGIPGDHDGWYPPNNFTFNEESNERFDSTMNNYKRTKSIRTSQNKRTELLYNIDPNTGGYNGIGAIRIGDLKLIRGNPGSHDDHYPPANLSVIEDPRPQPREINENGGVYTINDQPIYLFNLVEDPYEYNNIAENFPEIVADMMSRLDEYQASMIPPNIADQIEEGNPSHFKGVWSPGWCESEP